MRRFAAWLGVLALLVQVLIPALLAAELKLAQDEHGQSVFTLCAFGHLHVATHDSSGTGPEVPGHDQDVGALCPICLALLASPAFTAPPLFSLPLPVVTPLETFTAVATQPRAAVAVTAYRSRAPPNA